MPDASLTPAPVSATQGRRDASIDINKSTDSLIKRIRPVDDTDPRCRMMREDDAYFINRRDGTDWHSVVQALVDQGSSSVLSRSARQSSQGRAFITNLEQCESPVDAVINLAGAGLADRRWTAGYKRTIERSRIDLTQQLVSWIESQATRPKTLISASAIGYYGASQDDAFTEQGPPGTGFAADLCRDGAEALRAKRLRLMCPAAPRCGAG